MAQYHIPDPEDLIECPYDKVHMVRAKRMQYHLMKCRKNYTGRDFATCPFNARHEMPKPELRYHMVNCPDKAMIEASLSYEKAKKNGEGTMFKGCTDVPVYDNYVPPCEENWDEEIPAVPRIGVDPSFFARIDQRVLTTGLSKAKKKEYNRQMFLPPEERRFVSELNYTDKNSEGEVEEEKLRLPKSAPKTFVSSNQQNIQQPSTVFAYSLSMAGVGRGHNGMNGINPCAVINGGPESVNHSAMNGVNPSLGMLGRGRGLCRGSAPPGFYPNSTGRGLGVQPPAPSIAPSDPLENIPGVPLDSNSVFSMGVGRGRGNRTQASGDNPQFVVPNASFITEVSKQNGNNNHDLREEKKLRKKLRQIELLEKKAEEG